MLLTGAFLRATAAWKAQRKVLNISSGLGRRPMASQAAYCAAKAGMDHFTRCVALEEAAAPNGAKICSLAPGVIDTDMQVQLRGADASRFPDIGTFIGLKDKGVLASPAGRRHARAGLPGPRRLRLQAGRRHPRLVRTSGRRGREGFAEDAKKKSKD